MKNNKIFSAIILTGMLGSPVYAYHNDDDTAQRTFGGALVGAATLGTVGGVAGGWKGAAIGAGTGAVLGGAIGASRSRDPHAWINKLYKRRDLLMRRISETTSEKRRERYQRELERVNEDIRRHEEGSTR